MPRLKAEAGDEMKFHRPDKDIWRRYFCIYELSLSKLNLRRRNNFQDNKIAQPIFRLAFYLKGRPKTEGLYQLENN